MALTTFNYPHLPIYAGAQPHDFAQASTDVPRMGIYAQETTQRYVLATRHITWDGRVFKYARAGNTNYTGQGSLFFQEEQVGYTTVGDSQVIGDTTITIDSQTVAEDLWQGGYVIIYGADNSDVQNRGIMGNSAASTSTVTVYLDAPLATAITADSTGVELLGNPYYDLRQAGTNYVSIAGLPAVKATVGQFFWVQTWGICWIAPGEAAVGDTANERQVIFDASVGSLHEPSDATFGTDAQHAGFIIQKDSAGSGGPPFIMLQISI